MNDSLISFSGWLGTEVEIETPRENVEVATFRVGSTPRRFRDGRWENGETVWYTVKAWRTLAHNLARSLRKGDPVLVTGRMTAESWTAQDGTPASRHVVVAVAVGHDLNLGTSHFGRTRHDSANSARADQQAPEGEEESGGGGLEAAPHGEVADTPEPPAEAVDVFAA